MIELWELGGKNDCRYSTFSWRTRLALLHKGLAFEVHPVSVADKGAIRFSGQDLVPIIRDGDRIVSDSWKIACFLEQTYPDRPALFGGALGRNLTYFFNMWADRELIPLLVPPLMLDVLGCVGEAEAVHHRTQMETIFKRKLEDLYAERAKTLEQFRKRLAPVRRILSDQAFIGGKTPAYADHILFGVLQWARVVSLEQVLDDSDVIERWFERVLDLYDGAGRREPARRERAMERSA
jgi:glutathione S-transferase